MRIRILLFSMFVATSALASEYPSDYATGDRCQTKGPLTVCEAVQLFYRAGVLNITYNGWLNPKPNLAAYVIVHYNDGDRSGDFPMTLQNPFSSAPQWQVRITGGCVVASPISGGGCAQLGTPQMSSLMYWSVNEFLGLNALNMEVSIHDQTGEWDNYNGIPEQNYPFQF